MGLLLHQTLSKGYWFSTIGFSFYLLKSAPGFSIGTIATWGLNTLDNRVKKILFDHHAWPTRLPTPVLTACHDYFVAIALLIELLLYFHW